MSEAAINSPALAANLRYYEEHAEDYVQTTAALDLSVLQTAFVQHLPPGAKILDAGCGSGRDSAVFLRREYRVLAIDASPAIVRAAQRLGVSAKVMTFQEMRFDAEFDGVWACASLLHVPRSEIDDVLLRFRRALRAGGVLFITLKKGGGEGVSEDGRFFAYYELEEFSELISRVGSWSSHIAKQTIDGKNRPWLNFLVRKAAPSALPFNPTPLELPATLATSGQIKPRKAA
jgi:SAM-dependent methyltransferase